MDWYERAEQQLVDEYNNGTISMKEFNAAMRDLNAELRDSADQAAEEARDAVLGGRW